MRHAVPNDTVATTAASDTSFYTSFLLPLTLAKHLEQRSHTQPVLLRRCINYNLIDTPNKKRRRCRGDGSRNRRTRIIHPDDLFELARADSSEQQRNNSAVASKKLLVAVGELRFDSYHHTHLPSSLHLDAKLLHNTQVQAQLRSSVARDGGETTRFSFATVDFLQYRPHTSSARPWMLHIDIATHTMQHSMEDETMNATYFFSYRMPTSTGDSNASLGSSGTTDTDGTSNLVQVEILQRRGGEDKTASSTKPIVVGRCTLQLKWIYQYSSSSSLQKFSSASSSTTSIPKSISHHASSSPVLIAWRYLHGRDNSAVSSFTPAATNASTPFEVEYRTSFSCVLCNYTDPHHLTSFIQLLRHLHATHSHYLNIEWRKSGSGGTTSDGGESSTRNDTTTSSTVHASSSASRTKDKHKHSQHKPSSSSVAVSSNPNNNNSSNTTDITTYELLLRSKPHDVLKKLFVTTDATSVLSSNVTPAEWRKKLAHRDGGAGTSALATPSTLVAPLSSFSSSSSVIPPPPSEIDLDLPHHYFAYFGARYGSRTTMKIDQPIRQKNLTVDANTTTGIAQGAQQQPVTVKELLHSSSKLARRLTTAMREDQLKSAAIIPTQAAAAAAIPALKANSSTSAAPATARTRPQHRFSSSTSHSALYSRQWYHASTGVPLSIADLNYDSDEHVDEEWYIESQARALDEIDHLSTSERAFMKIWNEFIHRRQAIEGCIYADYLFPRLCLSFAIICAPLISPYLRTAFLCHLMTSWEFGLIEPNQIEVVMARLDEEAAKMKTTTTTKQKTSVTNTFISPHAPLMGDAYRSQVTPDAACILRVRPQSTAATNPSSTVKRPVASTSVNAPPRPTRSTRVRNRLRAKQREERMNKPSPTPSSSSASEVEEEEEEEETKEDASENDNNSDHEEEEEDGEEDDSADGSEEERKESSSTRSKRRRSSRNNTTASSDSEEDEASADEEEDESKSDLTQSKRRRTTHSPDTTRRLTRSAHT